MSLFQAKLLVFRARIELRQSNAAAPAAERGSLTAPNAIMLYLATCRDSFSPTRPIHLFCSNWPQRPLFAIGCQVLVWIACAGEIGRREFFLRSPQTEAPTQTTPPTPRGGERKADQEEKVQPAGNRRTNSSGAIHSRPSGSTVSNSISLRKIITRCMIATAADRGARSARNKCRCFANNKRAARPTDARRPS